MDRPATVIHPLTSLRFFAALGVFLHHLAPAWSGSPVATSTTLQAVLFEGSAGVSFFFLLSGFILAHNYSDRFRGLTWAAAKDFYVARFARIYPLHLLTFAASLPLVVGFVSAHPARGVRFGVANLALVHAFVPNAECYRCFNAVSWSLSVEAFLYACFPTMAWTIGRFGWQRAKTAAVVAATVCLLMAVVSWTGLHSPHPRWAAGIFPIPRLLDFLLGALLCFIWRGLRETGLGRCSVATGTVVEVGALGLLVGFVCAAPLVPMEMRCAGYYPAAMAVVILAFALRRGLLSKGISRPALCYLGDISFAFYMTHMLVFAYLVPFRFLQGFGAAAPVAGALYWLLGSLVVSAICHKGFERPARTWIVQRFRIASDRRIAPAVSANSLAVP
jgi:peptidoglycan/LPS O-acetylase OafA/YrhL